MVARGLGWGKEEIVRDFGMDVYTLLYLKWIINKDLLYSTWNSVLWISLVGRGVGGKWICLPMAESLAVHLKLSHC